MDTVKYAIKIYIAMLMMLVPASVYAGTPQTLAPGLSFNKMVKGLSQSQLRNDGAIVSWGRVSGTGHIAAEHIIIEGSLSPGNSPGCLTFAGDVTFSSTATVTMELAGTAACMEYDQFDVANQLTINNASLEVVLLDGFIPAYGDRFDLMNWGSITGAFGTVDTSAAVLPAPLLWDSSELYLTGELIVGVQQFADGDLAPWSNPDGVINAADVMIAQQLILETRTPGVLQYAHGDMNNDGVINAADLLLIMQLVL